MTRSNKRPKERTKTVPESATVIRQAEDIAEAVFTVQDRAVLEHPHAYGWCNEASAYACGLDRKSSLKQLLEAANGIRIASERLQEMGEDELAKELEELAEELENRAALVRGV